MIYDLDSSCSGRCSVALSPIYSPASTTSGYYRLLIPAVEPLTDNITFQRQPYRGQQRSGREQPMLDRPHRINALQGGLVGVVPGMAVTLGV